jgi:hypothetical protein
VAEKSFVYQDLADHSLKFNPLFHENLRLEHQRDLWLYWRPCHLLHPSDIVLGDDENPLWHDLIRHYRDVEGTMRAHLPGRESPWTALYVAHATSHAHSRKKLAAPWESGSERVRVNHLPPRQVVLDESKHVMCIMSTRSVGLSWMIQLPPFFHIRKVENPIGLL